MSIILIYIFLVTKDVEYFYKIMFQLLVFLLFENSLVPYPVLLGFLIFRGFFLVSYIPDTNPLLDV